MVMQSALKPLFKNSGISSEPGASLYMGFSKSSIAVHSRCDLTYMSTFTKSS